MTTTARRLMRTPEIEPLTVAPADRMPNVVALIARAAERNADREAHALEGDQGAASRTGFRERVDEPHLPGDVGLGDEAVARAQGPRHRRRRRRDHHRPHATGVDDRRPGLACAGGRDLPDLSSVGARPGRVRDQQRAGPGRLRRERAAGYQDRLDPVGMPHPRARHHPRPERQVPRWDPEPGGRDRPWRHRSGRSPHVGARASRRWAATTSPP